MRRVRGKSAVALLAVGVAAAAVVVAIASRSHGSPRAPRPAARSGAPSRRHARAPRRVHGSHDRPVPILMYHVIARAKPGAPYPELYTPPRVFAAQMRALHRRGYHAVTLRHVDRYWTRGDALPRRPVVLSFDDGYLGDYTHALPVLRALGWRGVLNLVAANVRRGDLDAYQVRALIHAGWEVDSHTLTHPDLTTLGARRLRREVAGSRAFLRRRFGVAADYFCYPSGRFDARVVAAVRRAGYRLATTTQPGLARRRDRFTLDRIRIDGADGVRGMLEALAHPGAAQGRYAGG